MYPFFNPFLLQNILLCTLCDRATSYQDAKSTHTSGKQAYLPAAPSLRSELPPIQVLVPIEGCLAHHLIPAMILRDSTDVQQVMDDLHHVCERAAQMSIGEEWGMEGEEVGSHHIEDCSDYIQDGQFAIPRSYEV